METILDKYIRKEKFLPYSPMVYGGRVVQSGFSSHIQPSEWLEIRPIAVSKENASAHVTCTAHSNALN
jgi:hypothetical protein